MMMTHKTGEKDYSPILPRMMLVIMEAGPYPTLVAAFTQMSYRLLANKELTSR